MKVGVTAHSAPAERPFILHGRAVRIVLSAGGETAHDDILDRVFEECVMRATWTIEGIS